MPFASRAATVRANLEGINRGLTLEIWVIIGSKRYSTTSNEAKIFRKIPGSPDRTSRAGQLPAKKLLASGFLASSAFAGC